MKWITVNAYEVALIMKRGVLVNVLTEGRHWIGFCKRVLVYSMAKPLVITTDLALMLEDPELKEMLDVVTIKDHEIGLEFRDRLYKRLLLPCKMAYWKSTVKYEVKKVDLSKSEISEEIPMQVLMKPELINYTRTYPVESFQRGILYIDGEYQKILEPGVYRYWKCDKIATVVSVDMRLRSMEILGQEILTKDKVGIRVNFQAQYQVQDVEKAIKEAKDYEKQLYILLQIGMREYVGSLTLDQLLANKEKVGTYIVSESKVNAEILGVEIMTGGIKDIILPGDVKDIMNQVLIAQKKAQANTIMRQEETASTRSLLNTAKLMDDNAMLLKLKEMEYMEKIADKVGEISVNANGRIIDQLNGLLVTTRS